jgi:hypothetical protein
MVKNALVPFPDTTDTRILIYIMDTLYATFTSLEMQSVETELKSVDPSIRITLLVGPRTVEIVVMDRTTPTSLAWKMVTSRPHGLFYLLDHYALKLPSNKTTFLQNMVPSVGLKIGPFQRKQALQNTFDASRAPILSALKNHSKKRLNKAEKTFITSIDHIGLVPLLHQEKMKIT